jgi:hypothetical protein
VFLGVFFDGIGDVAGEVLGLVDARHGLDYAARALEGVFNRRDDDRRRLVFVLVSVHVSPGGRVSRYPTCKMAAGESWWGTT